MKLIRKNKKGFTLVELIVVIAILAILALILIPAITGYVGKANVSKDQANARAIYSAAVLELSTGETVYTEANSEALTSKVKDNTGIKGGFSLTIGTDGKTVTVTVNNEVFDGQTFTKANP